MTIMRGVTIVVASLGAEMQSLDNGRRAGNMQ